MPMMYTGGVVQHTSSPGPASQEVSSPIYGHVGALTQTPDHVILHMIGKRVTVKNTEVREPCRLDVDSTCYVLIKRAFLTNWIKAEVVDANDYIKFLKLLLTCVLYDIKSYEVQSDRDHMCT